MVFITLTEVARLMCALCLTGQTNYGYANACEDLLAERRRADGLPALSIQWGVIDGVGVADAHIQARCLSVLSNKCQSLFWCLALLDQAITSV